MSHIFKGRGILNRIGIGQPKLQEPIERMNSTLLGLLARSKWTITEEQAEWVLLDDQVNHAFNQLAGAITANPWRIEHDDPKVVEFCENALNHISPGGNQGGTFNQFVRTLLKAPILGHLHINFVWRNVPEMGGAFLPTEYFRLSNTTIIVDPISAQLEYHGTGGPTPISTGDPIQAKRFRRWVLNLAFGGDGHPFGASLARILWWPVSLRRDGGITNWAVGMERFALPGIVGKLGGNPSPEEMEAYKDLLVEWRNQFVAIAREDDDIAFENTSASWNPAHMEAFAGYMDRVIDKNILGQSGTSGDRSGTTGTFAETKVQFMVRADLVEDRSDWIGDVVSTFLFDIVTHPENAVLLGVVEKSPRFKYQVADGSAEARVENIKWAFEQGITLDAEQLYGELELVNPNPVEGATLVKAQPTFGPSLPFERHFDRHIHLQQDPAEKPRTLPEWLILAGQVHSEAQRNAWKPIDDTIVKVVESIKPEDWKRGIGNKIARKISQTISPEDRQPLVDAIANTTLHGQMLGRHAVDSARTVSLGGVQTQRENDEAFLRSIGIFEDMSERGLTDDFFMPVSDMDRIFRDPQIVDPNAWEQSQARSQRWGFWVTGLEEEERIRSVARALDNAIAGGKTFKQFKSESSDVIGGFDESRQSTIFRTNMLQASSVGSFARMKDPRIEAEVKFWVYSNPSDLRSRPAHGIMDGKRFKSSNAIWNFWYIPNGFNCRCDVYTQWKEEKGAPTREDEWPLINGRRVMPDDGFRSNGAAELLNGNFEVMR